MAHTLELQPDSFEREVLQETMPVLVEFWSRTCPHCLALDPHLEQAAAAEAGRTKFCKLSLQDNAMPLFRHHGVSCVPTLILFRGGREVARNAGSRTAQQILAWLREHE
jgi:thioredoxin 2